MSSSSDSRDFDLIKLFYTATYKNSARTDAREASHCVDTEKRRYGLQCLKLLYYTSAL